MTIETFMMDKNEKGFYGHNGSLILSDKGVIIRRGTLGFLFGGLKLRGNKFIPYSGIVAVQLKKAGFFSGYIQLTLKGGPEAKDGYYESLQDENTITFYFYKNKDFQEAKQLIEERISTSQNSESGTSDGLNDLEKLASLKKKGVISEKEFNKKKKQILGV